MAVFLRLLSTDHCSLCDEAMSILFSMPDIAGLELQVTDVVGDEELLETYGERVPVLQLLKRSDQREPAIVLELNWPFSAESVARELRNLPADDKPL